MRPIFLLPLFALGCIDATSTYPEEAITACADAPECPEGMVRFVDDEANVYTPGSLSITQATCGCIDQFEASRGPGGTAESQQGEMPWTGITFTEARAACEAAGKRLCTGREWTAACAGLPATKYPYGRELIPGACNTNPAVRPTGSFTECEGGWPGLFDMSGNAAEWTGNVDDPGACGPRGCAPHGGSGSQQNVELACGYRTGFTSTSTGSDIGFRCCKTL